MSPRPIELDHVVLKVGEVSRVVDFYVRVLGAEVVELTAGRVGLRIGERQLNLHAPGSTPHPVAAALAPPGAFDLCFVWPGTPAEALAYLRHCGVEPELGPVRRTGARGVGTSVYFRDPEGNLLEFLAYDVPPAGG